MSPQEDTYRMPRSTTEAQRLEQQSRVFQTSLDYLIHPHILKTLPRDAKVADIGCGTGSYLVDVSRLFSPSATFDGFDISSEQFRAEGPENVSLYVADVRSPFPSELHHQYDMVHLRLLVAGLDRDDWAVALQNVRDLLKPTGAIQWEEADFITGRRLRGGPGGTSGANLAFALQPMVDLFSDRFRYGYSTLLTHFRDAGLHRTLQDVVSSDRLVENRFIMGLLSIQAVFEWARREKLLGRGDLWHGHELEEVEEKAYKELEDGAYAQFDIYCFIGFMNA